MNENKPYVSILLNQDHILEFYHDMMRVARPSGCIHAERIICEEYMKVKIHDIEWIFTVHKHDIDNNKDYEHLYSININADNMIFYILYKIKETTLH